MKYAFELGHQPHISQAEIETVLTDTLDIKHTVIKKENTFLLVEIHDSFSASELMRRLGGTISINEYMGNASHAVETIADHLESETGKINFSVKGGNKKLGLEIKKELKARGKSVRYVEPKNTATIIHNKLVESKSNFTTIGNELYVTLAVQDIEQFTERDYGRPQADDKSGMLPPKLARIMINLTGADTDTTIIDPFCGSGTVLIEAIDIGFTNVIGNDISKKAVSDTQKNIQWFLEKQKKKISYQVHALDAAHIHSKVAAQSVDAIVSEPFLGKPLNGRETKQFILNQTHELADMYIESFKSFSKILKKNGVVVFIIPEFKYNNKEWITIPCIPQIQKIGFTLVPMGGNDSLLYHRPEQFLGRRVYKFEKK